MMPNILPPRLGSESSRTIKPSPVRHCLYVCIRVCVCVCGDAHACRSGEADQHGYVAAYKLKGRKDGGVLKHPR